MARAANTSRAWATSRAGNVSRVRTMSGGGNTYLARNTYLAWNMGGLRSAKAARPSAASSVAKQTVWSWRS